MIRKGAFGLLLLLAACSDVPPRPGQDTATAAADNATADTAQLRVAAESAAAVVAARDSTTAAGERGALAPIAQGWTADPTAVQLSAGSLATLRSVRESAHEGFDRVVFDFGERSMPNYRIEYVDSPQHQCGSGQEVRLKGGAWVAVELQPVQAHDDAGNATVVDRSREPGFDSLRELRLTCDFEGRVTWVAGLAGRKGYRAMMMQQPTRLVVDFKH